jgi:hypothetical protein
VIMLRNMVGPGEVAGLDSNPDPLSPPSPPRRWPAAFHPRDGIRSTQTCSRRSKRNVPSMARSPLPPRCQPQGNVPEIAPLLTLARVRVQVERVAIHEVKGANVDPTKAVRIFVKFVRQESSMKALVDLNGRHFGGKSVEGSFYPEAKFDQAQLAPAEGEA